jgi:hypothetical protein
LAPTKIVDAPAEVDIESDPLAVGMADSKTTRAVPERPLVVFSISAPMSDKW